MFRLLSSALLLFVISGSAQAKAPVVIEFFGLNGCVEDTKTQERLENLMRENDEVILLNCRSGTIMKGATQAFTNSLCFERQQIYSRGIQRNVGYAPSAHVFVNGQWDAYYENIMPAVKLGRIDNILNIDLEKEQGFLNINLPDFSEKAKSGDMFVFAYKTSEDEKVYTVDPDVKLTDEVQREIASKRSVPFVTERRTSQLYIRPVVGIKHVGHFEALSKGLETQVSVALSDMESVYDIPDEELSYVAVLYKDGPYGPIMAAGEIMSKYEKHRQYPKSEAPDYEFISPPIDAAARP
ncbi:MAG: hypothetical protein GC137_02875 [Alphaproteobacteria bacterium]|nr:hypothetical protein [Alphaproteobacteria bacterium]